jgi:hypothetical protein
LEYKIISECSTGYLVQSVMEAIKDGWTPIGGVCVFAVKERGNYDEYPHCTETQIEYSQAMTKGNANDNEHRNK